MAIKIIPFEPEHLLQLKMQPHELDILNPKRFISTVTAEGNQCISVFYDGKLLGIGGYLTLWPGVLEMYLAPSIHIFEYPMIAFRVTDRIIKRLKSQSHIHRLQTSVLDDRRRTKFVEKLGMVWEGRMKRYTSKGEDYLMYAWVRE